MGYVLTAMLLHGAAYTGDPMEVRMTAYTIGFESTGKRPGDRGYGVTATGWKIRTGDRIVAVDPRVIHLHSVVWIDGVPHLAEDTGGAIKGRRIDVLFTGRTALRDAIRFGVRRGVVIVRRPR